MGTLALEEEALLENKTLPSPCALTPFSGPTLISMSPECDIHKELPIAQPQDIDS